MTYARDVLERVEFGHGEMIAPVPSNPNRLSAPYVTVSRTLAYVLDQIRAGAVSAASGDTSALTYADGWTAASLLARLAAAEALAVTAEDSSG